MLNDYRIPVLLSYWGGSDKVLEERHSVLLLFHLDQYKLENVLLEYLQPDCYNRVFDCSIKFKVVPYLRYCSPIIILHIDVHQIKYCVVQNFRGIKFSQIELPS